MAASSNTVALSVLSALKSIGRKRIPIDYLAQSVNKSRAEVMPALSDLADQDVVHIDDEHVTLR